MPWEEMCYPKEEGGLDFRSLFDVSRAIHAKLWWNSRTFIASLWATYTSNKYCKKRHPLMVQSSGASQIWRSMAKIREEVEPYIFGGRLHLKTLVLGLIT